MRIKAFQALRPTVEAAKQVAAVPYDVVDTAEAKVLAEGNPLSFLHVSRPEIDLPPDTDIHSDAVYAQGRKALDALFQAGTLLREGKDSLYLYRQTMGEHRQTGLVATCHVGDYEGNIIRKHEKTRKDKEDDRTRHCLELNANTGPVFLTYRDEAQIDALAEAITATPPLYDFTADDGIHHTVWRVADDLDRWVSAFAKVPLAYIADGHHRAAASARAGRERRLANPAHDGTEEYNWFLAVLFPASQLKILPYNRCVADLNGLSVEAFLKQVRDRFRVAEVPDGTVSEGCRCRMYLAGKWYELAWDAPSDGDPVKALDVSVLQDSLLSPVLGIDDPRTNERISFVGGIRGVRELSRRVDSGRDAVAFSMFPVTVGQMMAIADAGAIMPPKSTWFEPKLRSGLLVHTLD